MVCCETRPAPDNKDGKPPDFTPSLRPVTRLIRLSCDALSANRRQRPPVLGPEPVGFGPIEESESGLVSVVLDIDQLHASGVRIIRYSCPIVRVTLPITV